MASGRKQMVINTQERAISPDVNRLQAFAAKDDAELWRYLMDVTSNDDVNTGFVAEHTSLENPLRGEITNGIMVRPQPGSLNLLVDPGVLYVVSPDADADASVYKYVRDLGVTLLGSLVVTPGGGATRIDVVECQISAVALTATDNRDIFNPVTGLFTATVVTKETQLKLSYRVRAGVAGGGFPGTTLGWLPIAVISVPAAAPNVDTMTFWDVRPLVSDRTFGPSAITLVRPRVGDRSMFNATALVTATGLIDATFDGYHMGGRLRSGSAGVADADNINVALANNQEPGIVFTPNRPWYLYLLFPYGLPRWARYNGSALPRVPRNPKGIPVVSMIAPDTDGLPTAAITPPTATGLVVPSALALAVAGGFTTPGGAQGGFFGDNNSGFIFSDVNRSGEPLEVASSANSISGFDANLDYILTSGVDFPAHARALFLEPRCEWLTAAGPTRVVIAVVMQVFAPNGGGVIHQRLEQGTTPPGAAGAAVYRGRFCDWVQIPTLYPANAVYTIQVRLTLQFDVAPGGGPAIGTNFVRVLGYKL